MAAHLLIAPPFKEVHVDTELVEHAGDGLIDHIIEGLGPMIERRHRRKNHRSHPRQGNHALQVPQMERRLARKEHQLLSLFEHHIGGPHQKVAGYRVGDPAHRFHRARGDHHALRAEGAARYTGADIVDVVNVIRHRLHFFGRVRGLHLNRHLGRTGQHQMGLNVFNSRKDL